MSSECSSISFEIFLYFLLFYHLEKIFNIIGISEGDMISPRYNKSSINLLRNSILVLMQADPIFGVFHQFSPISAVNDPCILQWAYARYLCKPLKRFRFCVWMACQDSLGIFHSGPVLPFLKQLFPNLFAEPVLRSLSLRRCLETISCYFQSHEWRICICFGGEVGTFVFLYKSRHVLVSISNNTFFLSS